MGEVAGVVFWGHVLGKQAFRQGAPRDRQGQGPGLGLGQGEYWIESPHSGSMGNICPRSETEVLGPMPAGQPQSTEHSSHPPESVSPESGL